MKIIRICVGYHNSMGAYLAIIVISLLLANTDQLQKCLERCERERPSGLTSSFNFTCTTKYSPRQDEIKRCDSDCDPQTCPKTVCNHEIHDGVTNRGKYNCPAMVAASTTSIYPPPSTEAPTTPFPTTPQINPKQCNKHCDKLLKATDSEPTQLSCDVLSTPEEQKMCTDDCSLCPLDICDPNLSNGVYDCSTRTTRRPSTRSPTTTKFSSTSSPSEIISKPKRTSHVFLVPAILLISILLISVVCGFALLWFYKRRRKNRQKVRAVEDIEMDEFIYVNYVKGSSDVNKESGPWSSPSITESEMSLAPPNYSESVTSFFSKQSTTPTNYSESVLNLSSPSVASIAITPRTEERPQVKAKRKTKKVQKVTPRVPVPVEDEEYWLSQFAKIT